MATKTIPPVKGMELKLDVTNPVMIQRAREQLEEAEKRAEVIKPLGSRKMVTAPLGLTLIFRNGGCSMSHVFLNFHDIISFP